ncbi:hypothetical protein ABIB73_000095 [Bradyrhizobium sp. F1.4.3]|uniref:hypothetical protein n=1 Tax=Bradyrhizobium sp. F1.4.3 TaxID=3156356 RepID=UPI003399E3DA
MSAEPPLAPEKPPTENDGYFRQFPKIELFHPNVRSASKWFLDFLRNIAVVAVINAFAFKEPGFTNLKVVAVLGDVALFAFLFSYVRVLPLPLPHGVARSNVGAWIWAALSASLFCGTIYLLTGALAEVVAQLTAIQRSKP